MFFNRFSADNRLILLAKQTQKESCMKKLDVETDGKKEDLNQKPDETRQNNIYDTEEIQIEELAVDGICGVY